MPWFCEAWAEQNEDGQGLLVVWFAAQFLGLGKVGSYFLLVT